MDKYSVRKKFSVEDARDKRLPQEQRRSLRLQAGEFAESREVVGGNIALRKLGGSEWTLVDGAVFKNIVDDGFLTKL